MALKAYPPQQNAPNNPILSIMRGDIYKETVSTYYSCPAPSSYSYELQDVSAEDSGRTEDMTMWKNRIGQIVALNLEWAFPTKEVASEVLQLFNSEYITLTYLDALTGTWDQDVFYVADRSVPMYNNDNPHTWSSISLQVIKRYVREFDDENGVWIK